MKINLIQRQFNFNSVGICERVGLTAQIPIKQPAQRHKYNTETVQNTKKSIKQAKQKIMVGKKLHKRSTKAKALNPEKHI